MQPYLESMYGNPSSLHKCGRQAERAIRQARQRVAALIGARQSEILITSGATESNNMAIAGAAMTNGLGHIITSSIEHEAVLEPCKRLQSQGYSVSYLSVDRDGLVDSSKVSGAITDKTFLVSVMLANNEVGAIQPVQEIAQACQERGVLLHTDAVQAVGKIPISVDKLGVDMLSVSSHKMNGPKGVGALYVRTGTRISPLILGGGQEGGMRSGTENVAGIAGLGKACQMAQEYMDERMKQVAALRDLLVELVLAKIPNVQYNGSRDKRLPGNAHFTFAGINGEDLIIKLDENGIAASTGSACSVRTQKASHVLEAMGFDYEEITGSLRLTVGIYNTKEEILQAVRVLKSVTAELRSVSPFKTKYGWD